MFHDDQHGTAIVVLAALTNALRVVGKRLEEVKIVTDRVWSRRDGRDEDPRASRRLPCGRV